MPLLSLQDVTVTFAGPPLLDAVRLAIDDGERLGLLGRNGAGKSTLLRVLEGVLPPDSGTVVRAPGLSVASLPQDVPFDLAGTVGAYLHAACGVAASDAGWEIEARIDQAASDLALALGADLPTLSAGSKRRVLLAAALVRDPDLLLLDEPTNHLDVPAIEHLEEALARRRGALLFVTHDRAFLRGLATRILDLDRGALRGYAMGYDAYLARREDERQVEAEHAALFDKKLAEEEAWVRRGIKARRTRNEGRVRALEALRLERAARRDEAGRVGAQLLTAERSGKVVLRVENASFAYDTRPIVAGLTVTLQRGDRVGILGPNGSGKTTLLRLLLGELAPQSGTVKPGTKLEVAHFAQLADVADESMSLVDCVAEGRETIRVGEVDRHVVGYLRDFLFTADQIRGPVAKLSGGEKKRLQLARLLSRPANLMVLDEPTNDLDLETLELLEELLLEYHGTLLVVSHDRAFLDNVVTSTLVAEGEGRWGEYVGGYADWVRQTRSAAAPRVDAKPARSTRPGRPASADAPRRASFKERKELADLPVKIEQLEAEKDALFERMGAPDFYRSPAEEIARAKDRLAALDGTIHAAYARWQELEAIVGSG